MSTENEVKVTITLEDTYLDLSYYKVQVLYWDKEQINKKPQPCFKIGSLLVNEMKQLDSMNTELLVEFKIKNNPLALVDLQCLSGQRESKQSLSSIATKITDSPSEAKYIKEFLRFHNCTFS